ncbi:MAG: tRNA glutamyl-Q(34) synthetase GluQRS [Pseudomonadales bacterium]|nr:tRNA glutamyl-Q(34) synthetase GluQRS [Pseudomonadales bacterium]
MSQANHSHPSSYVGRFAPSPTGLLHFGSLMTAVASYLDAKAHQGKWLVRIEDLDPPRETPGASEEILRTLEAYGLHWDGSVWKQSERHTLYERQVNALIAAQQAYYCTCSRKPLIRKYGGHYPGICRGQFNKPDQDAAIRVLTHNNAIGFEDLLQGHWEQRLESETGDFIIKRKDGLYAYHLAVVMDDQAQNVTDIVRGLDLLDSTPRHLHLQQLLGYATPNYLHLPIIVNEQGHKLSKQTFAAAIPNNQPSQPLWQAISALGQQPPKALIGAPPQELLQWGQANWCRNKIPRQAEINESQLCP